MIIYVNIDKTTGQITVNNDLYPNTDIVQFNPNTLEETETNIKFEIAFNTNTFEEKLISSIIPEVNIDGNNN